MKSHAGEIRLNEIYGMAFNSLEENKREKYLENAAYFFEKPELKDETYIQAVKSRAIKDYRDSMKGRLEQVCPKLGISFADFAPYVKTSEKGAYGKTPVMIPAELAPLLIAILRSDGNKKGYISSLKTGKFHDITLGQKKEFISIYQEELVRAKEYTDTITDTSIENTIQTLIDDAEQEEHAKETVNRIENNILGAIKRDIYQLNKATSHHGLGVPYYDKKDVEGWFIKSEEKNHFQRFLNPQPECIHENAPDCEYKICANRKRCANTDCIHFHICKRCFSFDECDSIHKSHKEFTAVDELESSYFTDIYIGMLEMARHQFLCFIDDYADSVTMILAHIYADLAKKVVTPKSMKKDYLSDKYVKEVVSDLIIDKDRKYYNYIYKSTLGKLNQEGFKVKFYKDKRAKEKVYTAEEYVREEYGDSLFDGGTGYSSPIEKYIKIILKKIRRK